FIFLLVMNVASLAQMESQVGWIAKFGGAVGFSPVILFPNFDDVNVKLKSLNMDELSGPVYAPGGSGYIYVMIIDNLRFGGIGFGGSQSSLNTVGDFENEIIYSLSGGAFTVEYTMPFIKNIALSAGLMLGGGGLDINVYQNNGSFDWNTVWDDVKDNRQISNKSVSMRNSFYLVSPTLNVDIPINRFIALRGGLGYQFAFGDSWEVANGKEIDSVPSNLNGNSFFIQTGVYVGLFAF
ncbi:MAG: hypothetical protein GY936_01625, partial [Ignavibacteriae bacterium]|nr:hypothetical protein [Ignavibacteriota bacterium]